MTFVAPRRVVRIAILCTAVAVIAAMSPSSAAGGKKVGHMRHGHGDQPLHAQDCSNVVHEGTIVIYENTDFDGKVQVLNIAHQPRHELLPVHGKVGSKTSSLQWNLPEGIVVILYGRSRTTPLRQYVIWGKGQDNRLSGNGFNDRLSALCIEGFQGPKKRNSDRPHRRDNE